MGKGKAHEYVTTEERNADCCEDAVCTCCKRSRGMYCYTLANSDEDDYLSDDDETIKFGGRVGKDLSHSFHFLDQLCAYLCTCLNNYMG